MLKVTGYSDLKILYENKDTTVYMAIRESDNTKVTLKTYSSGASSQKLATKLLQEYTILKELAHDGQIPGILNVLDLIYEQKQPILVLEWAGNQSLKSFCFQNRLTLDMFFPIAIKLVETLSLIHGKKIIHKDLKPDNIIIDTQTLSIKLTDFSISTIASQNSVNKETSPDFLSGTLAYMPPEQTGRLNRSIDYRCDFYSLGVTFFELLTNNLPFQKTDPLELIYCHLAVPIPSANAINPNIPEQLSCIISKLMEKMPENRYMSSFGIQSDLEECYKQWQKNKEIELFPLAQHDVFDHLYISQKLYGREKEIDELRSAYRRISHGTKELILISGYSGTGKTSLMKKAFSPLILQHGNISKGKFDQLQQSTPYSAFTEAFESIVRQILMEPTEKINAIKKNLLKGLNGNGQLIIDVIPSLEYLIGPQNPVEPLHSPAHSQNRFIMTMNNFIRTLAREEHPLILFLDDCQWADNASLELIKGLMATPDIDHFLMVLAYRDNEVIGMHSFKITIDYLNKLNYPVTSILLTPLSETNIQELIADSFKCEKKSTVSLSSILFEKTQGNPFFINEFLKTLYQNEQLYFKNGRWQWNTNSIKQLPYTNNVIDLLIERFHQLSENTQSYLKTASCIGHIFDPQLLALIMKQPIDDIFFQLVEATEANFISCLGAEPATADITDEESYLKSVLYCFTHDKVQQAIYDTMSEKERTDNHLAIGLAIKDNTLAEQKNIINICRHLNIAKKFITHSEDRIQLAQYNLTAGIQFLHLNAYDAARHFFASAIEFLPKNAWEAHYQLTFDLYHQYAYSQFLNGNLKKAKTLFELLVKKCMTDNDRIKIYLSEGQLYFNQPNYEEAINSLAKVLKILNYKFPLKASKFTVIKEVITIEWLLRHRTKEDLLNAPELNDDRWLLILKTLNMIGLAAVLTNTYLLALTTLRTLNITLRYGNSGFSSMGFLSFGAILLRNKFDCRKSVEDRALKFFDLSCQLANKHTNKVIKGECYQFGGLAFQFRRHHIRDCVPFFEDAYKLSVETSNLAYAAYNLHHRGSALFMSGEPSPKLLEHTKSILGEITISSGREEYGCLTIIRQFHETLLDDKDHQWTFENFKEEAIGAYPLDNTLVKVPTVYHFRRGIYYFLMDNLPKALKHFEVLQEIYRINKYPAITFTWIIYYFYYPLTLTSHYKDLPPSEQKKSMKLIKSFLKLLESRSLKNPENHLNKYLLIHAEFSRLNNNVADAIHYYLQSIKAARENGFIHEEGIANERFATFYLELGDVSSAKAYLLAAYQKFEQWGVKAKQVQMEKKYINILDLTEKEYVTEKSIQPSTTLNTLELSDKEIDILSILKSTQAVSNEIILDNLLDKLVSILLENAGAQRIVILSRQGDGWGISAEGTHTKKKIYAINLKPISDVKDVPQSLIEYVQRTKRPLIVKNASSEYPETKDEYLQRKKAKSILVLPLIHQNTMNYIVYLENHSVEGAFTQQHLQTLQFIAAQTAISLKNASLFQQATHDTLTGLGNRNLLYSTFAALIANNSLSGRKIGVIFLDIDFFKDINDTLGHKVGDVVLIHVAETLKSCIRDTDLAVRLGGDEFVILLEGIESYEKIREIADRFYKMMEKPLIVKGKHIKISLSVGISIFPQDGTDIEDLLKKSDLALYSVKESGKNHYQFYSDL